MLTKFISIAFILSSFLAMAEDQLNSFGTDVVECKEGEDVSYELLELYEGKEIQNYTYNKINLLKGLSSDEVFAGIMKNSSGLAYGHSLKWDQYKKGKNPIIFKNGISIEGKDTSAVELKENCQIMRVASVFKDINKPSQESRNVVIDKDLFDRLDSLSKELVLLHSWLFYYAPLENLSNHKIRILLSKIFSDNESGPAMNRVDLMKWSIAVGDSEGLYAVTDSDGQKWIYSYMVEHYSVRRDIIKKPDAYPLRFINIYGEKYNLNPDVPLDFWTDKDGRIQILSFALKDTYEDSNKCAKIIVNKKEFLLNNRYVYGFNPIQFAWNGSLINAYYCSQHDSMPTFKGRFGNLFEYNFGCKHGAFGSKGVFECSNVVGELKSGTHSAVLYDRKDTSPLGPFQLSTPLLLDKENIEIYETILLHEMNNQILFSVKLSKNATIPYLNKDNGKYERIKVPAGKIVVLDNESRLVYVLRNDAFNRGLNNQNYMTIDEYLLRLRPNLVLNCRYDDADLNKSLGLYTYKISFSDLTVEIFRRGEKDDTGKVNLENEDVNDSNTSYDFTIRRTQRFGKIVISKAKDRPWVRDATDTPYNGGRSMSCK